MTPPFDGAGFSRQAAPAYSVSFTAASLRPELARIVAEAFLACGDWEVARARILDGNLLQARSRASALRREVEFRQRLQTLSEAELALVTHRSAEVRTAIAWLAVLKRSRFVFMLARDTLRDKLSALDSTFRPSDYERHFEAEAAAHPDLGALTAHSRAKVRQVTLRMLREAGLLAPAAGAFTLTRPLIPSPALDAILADDPRWLAGFLVPDAQIDALSTPPR